ncbi:MAG: U32 family peptidase [Lachnospiraceae bacterium]|nr:U32 family peptidase [Lachnospiraceae bacterium]
MRLLVPASTFNDAKELVENGADDIYLGAPSSTFNQYSFNGRANIAKTGKKVLPSIDEIGLICSFVQSKKGKVYFLANIPIVNSSSTQFYDGFMQYVDKGIKAGVDYIVLGDIITIKWVKEKYPDIKISASSYLEAQNELTLKMLANMGVSQAILSYQSTLEEIRDLCASAKIKIEVFGHGGCSFYVGTCNMFHEMGESSQMGYPCRALYEVSHKNKLLGNMRALDCFKICSLCKLKELEIFGVHSLKIVGRDLAADYILEIVKAYKNALKICRTETPITIERLNLPAWWERAWCQTGNLCRYGGVYY